MMEALTHIACSDESNWNVGRYRSIALVTAPTEHFNALTAELSNLLKESDVKEFRWKKLKTARERFAAQKLLDYVIKHSLRGRLRIDVMVWDIKDTRHAIRGRDDLENLQRMYYHLFKNVLRERWPDNSHWILYPDEHTDLDWKSVKDFLGHVDSSAEVLSEPLLQEPFRVRLTQEFSIYDIKEASAGEPLLVQLADLFAGIASYSREAYLRYCEWEISQAPQGNMFCSDETPSFSNAETERFKVLYDFDCNCKNNKIGVSLKTFGGFRTLDPKNPINFWWYDPQHEMDKAPTRRLMVR